MQQVKTLKLVALAGLAAVLLNGCSSVPSDAQTADGSDANGTGVVLGEGLGGGAGESFLGNEYSTSAPANQKYYFDYDKSEVHKPYLASIEAQSKYLQAHGNARVRIEGNTDERGSREYNIALGERRADAIAKVIELGGVPAKQVVVVSYGKERPAAEGHDETAYRLNRRADLVYEEK